jgi:hypothetical protein
MDAILGYLAQSRDIVQVAIDDSGVCGTIRNVAEVTVKALRHEKKLLLAGNEGSAADTHTCRRDAVRAADSRPRLARRRADRDLDFGMLAEHLARDQRGPEKRMTIVGFTGSRRRIGLFLRFLLACTLGFDAAYSTLRPRRRVPAPVVMIRQTVILYGLGRTGASGTGGSSLRGHVFLPLTELSPTPENSE